MMISATSVRSSIAEASYLLEASRDDGRPNFEERLPIGPSLASFLEATFGDKPFIDRTRLTKIHTKIERQYDYAIAIPVRNEEQLLPRTLAALEVAMSRSPYRGAVIFAINDSSDRSAKLVERWLERGPWSGAVLEIQFDEAIRNAPHSRRLAMDFAVHIAPSGAILTTDADTRVGLAWLTESLFLLRGEFGLVCEEVMLDPRELSKLPPIVRQVGDAERAYFGMCEQLWHKWTRGSGGRFTYRASGASMAIRSETYRAIGGLPLPDKGEDAALCAAVLARGAHVCQLANTGTRTSARLDSRAKGGCGDTLTLRAISEDPFCDESLMPLEALKRAALHPTKPRPTARPMRYSEVVRELELGTTMLGELV